MTGKNTQDPKGRKASEDTRGLTALKDLKERWPHEGQRN